MEIESIWRSSRKSIWLRLSTKIIGRGHRLKLNNWLKMQRIRRWSWKGLIKRLRAIKRDWGIHILLGLVLGSRKMINLDINLKI